MAGLLPEGERVPNFTLPAREGKTFSYGALAGKRRIVLVALHAPADVNERQWLVEAHRALADFRLRDMTVLVLTPRPEEDGDTRASGEWVVLHDDGGQVAARLGGPTALYLVGKDREIKRATRRLVRPSEIFRQVDAMPMRRQEMRERGG